MCDCWTNWAKCCDLSVENVSTLITTIREYLRAELWHFAVVIKYDDEDDDDDDRPAWTEACSTVHGSTWGNTWNASWSGVPGTDWSAACSPADWNIRVYVLSHCCWCRCQTTFDKYTAYHSQFVSIEAVCYYTHSVGMMHWSAIICLSVCLSRAWPGLSRVWKGVERGLKDVADKSSFATGHITSRTHH